MKFKRLAAFFLATAFVASSATNIFADEISFKVNGIVQSDKVNAKNVSGYMVMNGKDLAKMLSLKHEWNKENKTLKLSNGKITAVFKDGNTKYTMDKIEKYLPVVATVEDESLLLPLRSICEAFNINILWSGENNTVSIKTSITEDQLAVANNAKNPAAIKLSYVDALALAMRKNSNLDTLSENVDLNTKMREDYDKNYFDVSTGYINPATYKVDTDALTNWLITVRSMEVNAVILKLNEEILKTTSEFLLVSAITTLKTTEMDIQLLEQNISLMQKNYSNLQLKKDVGMASESDVKKARQDLDKAKANMATLQLAIKNQRITLNKVIGYNTEDIVEVDMTPKIEPLNKLTNSEIWGRITDDPSVKIKEEEYKLAKYKLEQETSTAANPDTNRIKTQNEVNKAGRDLTDTKNTMEKAMEAAQVKLETIIENNGILQLDLQKAKDAYNTALINFKAGLITQYEVDAAKSAVLKNEIEIAKNVYNYNLINFTIKRPFLL